MGKDHPRIRGEHFGTKKNDPYAKGSSPHTRGALKNLKIAMCFREIIPAYAGSTSRRRSRTNCGRDHPRIRGEHLLDEVALMPQSGSSPHTRGALYNAGDSLSSSRIIPAYAGSTIAIISLPLKVWDHPRIRGEHQPYICVHLC